MREPLPIPDCYIDGFATVSLAEILEAYGLRLEYGERNVVARYVASGRRAWSEARPNRECVFDMLRRRGYLDERRLPKRVHALRESKRSPEVNPLSLSQGARKRLWQYHKQRSREVDNEAVAPPY